MLRGWKRTFALAVMQPIASRDFHINSCRDTIIKAHSSEMRLPQTTRFSKETTTCLWVRTRWTSLCSLQCSRSAVENLAKRVRVSGPTLQVRTRRTSTPLIVCQTRSPSRHSSSKADTSPCISSRGRVSARGCELISKYYFSLQE